MEGLEAMGMKLGLVIDLTNTNRYYDGKVKYKKYYTSG